MLAPLRARFGEPVVLPWDGEIGTEELRLATYDPGRTHVFLAETQDDELAQRDTDEIAGARWGTLEELGGPLRERLLTTGRAFWRYRVALHDAALEALETAK